MMLVNRQQYQIDSVKHFVETFNETLRDRDRLKEIYNKSYAQLYQDMFALWYSNFKTNGYFVDFGATDGITISNTYLLEKDYGWSGIVAEPAKVWHNKLSKNRKCHISTDCVYTISNQQIMFDETSDPEWSSLAHMQHNEHSKMLRGSSKFYEVKTISLNDLLSQHQAPRNIDYLSIDTEGSELSILQSFDFSKYEIRFITCEHNDGSGTSGYRKEIYDFLSTKGYDRIWTHLSAQDDWYVLKKYNKV